MGRSLGTRELTIPMALISEVGIDKRDCGSEGYALAKAKAPMYPPTLVDAGRFMRRDACESSRSEA